MSVPSTAMEPPVAAAAALVLPAVDAVPAPAPEPLPLSSAASPAAPTAADVSSALTRGLAALNTDLLPAEVASRLKSYVLCLHTVITSCSQKEAMPIVKMLVDEVGVDIHQLVCLEMHLGPAGGAAPPPAPRLAPTTLPRLAAQAATTLPLSPFTPPQTAGASSSMAGLTSVMREVADALQEPREEAAMLEDVLSTPLPAAVKPVTSLSAATAAMTRVMPAYVPYGATSLAPATTRTSLALSARKSPPLPHHNHSTHLLPLGGDMLRNGTGRVAQTSTNAALMEKLSRSEAKAATVASKGIAMDALTAAASVGAGAVLLYLMAKGARVETRDSVGGTPLHHAVLGGHADVVQLLVKVGADINAPDFEGLTPLHAATSAHMPDIVALLLKLGANVNATEDVTGLTPLHTATDAATLSALLRTAAWRDAGRREGLLPPVQTAPVDASLSAAAAAAVPLSAVVARKAGASGAAAGGALKKAAFVTVEAEAAALPQVNKRSVRGWSPLYAVCYIGYPACARLLLDYGADPAALTDTGETPLHAACRSNVLPVVDMLLRAGADLNIVSHGGMTPLHIAAQLPDPMETALTLYRAGARACCLTFSPPRKCNRCRVILRRVQAHVAAEQAAARGDGAAISLPALDEDELRALVEEEAVEAATPARGEGPRKDKDTRKSSRKDKRKKAHARVSPPPIAAIPAAALAPVSKGVAAITPEVSTAEAIAPAAQGMPGDLDRALAQPVAYADSSGEGEHAGTESDAEEQEDGEEWTDWSSAVAALRQRGDPAAAVPANTPAAVPPVTPPPPQPQQHAAAPSASLPPHLASHPYLQFGRAAPPVVAGATGGDAQPRLVGGAPIKGLGGGLGSGLGIGGMSSASAMALATLGMASRSMRQQPQPVGGLGASAGGTPAHAVLGTPIGR